MHTTSKALSIIAYFLSEYDLEAVHALGYKTRSEAFKSISVAAGRDNNYLKLRRDEFDALPDSSSNRNGWRNRPPAKDVVELAAYLKTFSFDELSEIVSALLVDFSSDNAEAPVITRRIKSDSISEEELEQIINFSDPDAAIEVITGSSNRRVCKTAIVHRLKKLYKGRCQICGLRVLEEFDVDICEAHHIDGFAESQNNDAKNIIILCPNHHRLLHKIVPEFNRNIMCFIKDDIHLPVVLDYHLK